VSTFIGTVTLYIHTTFVYVSGGRAKMQFNHKGYAFVIVVIVAL